MAGGISESHFTCNQSHALHRWSGYTIMPEVEAKYGIRLDTNYYFWPEHGSEPAGFMTGSGMPMRFSTAEGNVLDVYQAATQMTDESGQSYPFTAESVVDRAQGPEGFYGAFVANMHTDKATIPKRMPLCRRPRPRSAGHYRPSIVNVDGCSEQFLHRGLQSTSNSLTFAVKASAAARGLKVMVPLPEGVDVAGITYNGKAIPTPSE